MHPRSPEAHSVFGTGALLLCQPSEACLAKSKPTFISKMGDVLEEADESGYWAELLVDSGKVDQQIAAPLVVEAKELVAIVISSINTAKRNSESED